MRVLGPGGAATLKSEALVAVPRASPVPGYSRILRHVMAPLGWSLEGAPPRPPFRKISCEIAYPLYGAEVLLVRE